MAAAGRAPGLAVVLVGDDPASGVDVASKGKATRAAGMASFEHSRPADATQVEVEETAGRLNGEAQIGGRHSLVPLTGSLDKRAGVEAIGPVTGVAGLTPATDRG